MRADRAAVAVLLVAGTAWAVGVAGPLDDGSPRGAEVDDSRLIRPVEGGSAIWPYTSRSRSAASRTLAINVLVAGEPDAVRRALTQRTAVGWDRAANDTRAAVDLEGVRWRAASGAARYTYMRPPGGEGRWVVAEYQVATGAYLGTRLHVRAFPSPGGDWTALQAHQEYWDWFRLRHTVTDVVGAGRFVEADLRDEPFVTEVRRASYGIRGGGSDGYLSVVEIALAALLLAGVVGDGRPRVPRSLRRLRAASVRHALVVSAAALYLGVRLAGVVLEASFPATNPKVFAALLYPVLAAGLPVVAWRLAPHHRPARAFGLAAVGLGVAIGIDFAALQVVPPPRLLLHRAVLVAALGVLAAGCAQARGKAHRLRWLGIAAWTGALVAPLSGVV